jgi:uncharacterized membrane protein HdeD (DUF308 family)
MDIQEKYTRLVDYAGITNLQRNWGWGWFVLIGVLLMILGIIAIITSATGSLATAVAIGGFLVAGGILQVINAIVTFNGTSFIWNALVAIFYIITGILLIMYPEVGALTLTVLLAAFFTVMGVFKILVAFREREAHWGWLALSGLITLVLGILTWIALPTGSWIFGLFIGIDLLALGWLWTALGIDAKNPNWLPPSSHNR